MGSFLSPPPPTFRRPDYCFAHVSQIPGQSEKRARPRKMDNLRAETRKTSF